MNQPVTLKFMAKKDPSLDQAFKTVRDFLNGSDQDITKVAQALDDLGKGGKRGAQGVDEVARGARRATQEATLLSKGLVDLRGQAKQSGRALAKSGEDLTRAFRKADQAPRSVGSSLTDLRSKLRQVGDTASAEFRKLKTEAKEAAESVGDIGANVRTPQELLTNLGTSIAIGTAVTTAFETSIQAAINFEAELRNLNTITELSDESLKAYGENLRTLSLELKTSTGAAENARAAYDVASAGFTEASANAKVLEATLKAATAGSVEAAEAARLISGSLRAYGADAADAERFTNVLFATVKSGITTFPQLSASLGNVTGIAAQAGISFEELGAAVATATARGIRTSQTIDGLRGAISNLLAPSEQAKKEMERLGIVVNEQTLKQKGLLNTLKEIAAANGGSAESFKKLLGDVQAFGVALALTSDGGELFAKNVKDIQTNTTALSDAVAEKSKAMQASIDQFKVALEAAGGAVGDSFLPAGKALVDSATAVVAGFAQLPEPVRTFVAVLGTMALATGATVKVVKLLATATQLETIQLGLNTAAKTLNTTVTTANARAAAVATAALVKKNVVLAATTIQARAAALSISGMAASMRASAAATGLLGGAFAVATGLVAAGGFALYEYTKIVEEQTAANEKLLEIELRMAKGQRNYAKLVKLTTAELREQKVAAEELTDALLANLERQEAAKEAGNEVLLERLRRENKDLREKRKALATDEAVERKQKKQPASANKLPVDEQKKADKAAEDRRKELLAAELSRIQVLKNQRELSAQEEIDALGRVLKEYKLKAEERRQIEERVAKLIGEQKVKAQKETEKQLERSLKAGTAIPEDISKNKKGTQAAVDAYGDAISKVEEWQRKNKVLIDQFPELGEKAESALEKLKAEKAAAETDRLSANFKKLQDELKSTEAEATSAAEKIDDIDEHIKKLKREQKAGNISLQDSEEELARLARERLATEQSITMQKLRQSGELNELEMEGVRQEIEALELLKEQGLDVAGQLLLKREELYQLRVKRLEDEYKAELETATDKLHVEKKYQLERRNLEREHTLNLSKEMKKRLDDAVTNQKKLSRLPDSDPTSSNGGRAELRLGEQSSNPSFFSVEASQFSFQTDEDKERKREKEAQNVAERRRLFERLNPNAALEVARVDSERAREGALRDAAKPTSGSIDPSRFFADRDAKLKALDPSEVINQAESARTNAKKEDSKSPTSVTYNTTINVDPATAGADAETIARAGQRIADRENRLKGLTGKGSGGSNSPLGYG